jgi:hypothetical protein
MGRTEMSARCARRFLFRPGELPLDRMVGLDGVGVGWFAVRACARIVTPADERGGKL